MGASGGGFASLQISALVPGSLAVPINPQTAIENYFVDGDPIKIGPQLSYALWVRPELTRKGKIESGWSEPLGERASTLIRYSRHLENYVYFVQNVNDFHYEQHYLPWLAAAARGDNLSNRFKVLEYDGPKGHVAPSTEITLTALHSALSWVK